MTSSSNRAPLPPGAPTARPEPNGIRSYLLLFGLAALVGWPLLTWFVLARLHGYAGDGPPAAYAILFFIAANGVYSFLTGYKILAGSVAARGYTALLLLFILIESTLFNVIFGFRSEIPLYLVPAAILLYFSRSELCRNNYGKPYRHLPLPSPLTPLLKRLCLAWGALAALLIAHQLVVCLVTPGLLEKNGFVPVARGVRAYTVTAGGTTMAIPVPSGATHVNREPKEEGDVRYVLRFAANNRNRNHVAHYDVGVLARLEDETLDASWLDLYEKVVRDTIAGEAKKRVDIAREKRYLLITERATHMTPEGLFVRRIASAHTLLMGKMLVLDATVVGPAEANSPDPAGMVRAWLELVAKNIPAEAPGQAPAPPLAATPKEMAQRMIDKEQNDLVRQSLRENGDSGKRPRLIDHWIYFPDRESRSALTGAILGKGFSIVCQPGDKEINDSYLLQIQRMDIPDALDTVVEELRLLAEAAGGEYDGWETMVLKE